MKRGVLAFFAVATALLVASCGNDPDGRSAASGEWAQDESESTPALAVEALEVSRGSLIQLVETSGTVRGGAEVSVVSEVQGAITDSRFELGQYVEAGDVLLVVESTVARLSVEEARGALDSARLDLAATERRFQAGSASQAELTRSRSNANGAEARYEAALKTLQDHTIRAPISGYVASRADDLSAGNYLNIGTPVARVVDLEMMEIQISVGERELQYITEGIEARVWIPVCGDTAIGRVEAIAAGAEERTGSFPVVVRWENDCDRARSGMSATVSIVPADASPAIVVPSAAIRDDGSGRYVFVAEGNTVSRRPITIGERLGDRVQVIDGLQEGEIIVTSALSSLDDGSLVQTTVRGTTGEVL